MIQDTFKYEGKCTSTSSVERRALILKIIELVQGTIRNNSR